MSNTSACLACGACCAAFRVSFYWAEADDAPGGWVPAGLTERLDPHLRCMRGTHARRPRCEQLAGEIPGATCRNYENRPSPCRELEPWDAQGRVTPQCTKARALHGLPPLCARDVAAATSHGAGPPWFDETDSSASSN